MLRALLLAPFSSSVYRGVARDWQGIGSLYLLLLVALAWAPPMLKLQHTLDHVAQAVQEQVAPGFPSITVQYGHVHVHGETPVEIRMDGDLLAVIDPDLPSTQYKADNPWVIIGADTATVRDEYGVFHTLPLQALSFFYLDRNIITQITHDLARWTAPLLYLALVASAHMWRVMLAVLFAVPTHAWALAQRKQLEFVAAIRVAAVAQTAVVWLDMILILLGWQIPMWWLLGLAPTVASVALAVRGLDPLPSPPAS